MIYEKKYGKITSIYKDQRITSELGIVIGAITESQELINYAATLGKGGQIDMCTALKELKEEGRMEGKEEILTEQIKKKLAKNKTPKEIADALEIDISVINRIIERINK